MKRRIVTAIVLVIIMLISCAIVGCENTRTDKGTGTGSGTGSGSGTIPPVTHKDNDNDGICDDCNASVIINYDIYGINDLHGKFVDTESQIGLDELTTYIKNARSTQDNVILLSMGDMWQGDAESTLTHGLIMTDWMNAIDFDCMTLGNHEYDWGETYIQNNADVAEFPYLAINIYSSITNELVNYCQPSIMIERGGIKIGVIGVMGDCYSSISSNQVEDVYFVVDTYDATPLTDLVKAESVSLRSQGADLIIYCVHDGYNAYDTELSSGGYVDLVFEGHTHTSYVKKDTYGIYHLQGGGDNDGITHVDLNYNYVTDTYKVVSANTIPTSTYASLADDPIIEQLLDKYEDIVGTVRDTIGVNDVTRDGDELRSLIAQLYYEKGIAKWSSSYDIVLGGGYLSVRAPYNLYAGDVTYADLLSIFPFNNDLVLCSVKGEDLSDKFFFSTNSNYYIHYGTYGTQVKNNIVDDQTYYVVVDTYTSTYAPNKLTEVARYQDGIYARDLLAEYIQNGGFTDRIIGGDYDLTDIPTLIEIGEALDSNQSSQDVYYVSGTITSIENTTTGIMTIVDSNGNSLYIYRLNSGATKYGDLDIKPIVGDTVVLSGRMYKYANSSSTIIELKDAQLVELVE
ncbi:MAG: 5'-nucleotidase C-terminal domain-containing protein [Clostridia bacterium]|nr:5'-nucleotidase C-terminal domain-containing protein [Clostridia bacterium]